MKTILTSTIRHLLTAAAGLLVAKGIINEAQAGQFVTGSVEVFAALVLFVSTLAWSWIEKKFKKKEKINA